VFHNKTKINQSKMNVTTHIQQNKAMNKWNDNPSVKPPPKIRAQYNNLETLQEPKLLRFALKLRVKGIPHNKRLHRFNSNIFTDQCPQCKNQVEEFHHVFECGDHMDKYKECINNIRKYILQKKWKTKYEDTPTLGPQDTTKIFDWRIDWLIFPFASHYDNNQHELIPSTINNSKYVEQTNMATLPREMSEIVKSFNIQHPKNILTILRHILRQGLFLKRQIGKERCLKNEEFTDRQQIKDYLKERTEYPTFKSKC
jgi:hypothetical protein